MDKIKILIMMRMYLPGHLSGGPITSIKNLTDCLYDKFDFYIVTVDRELKKGPPYDGINYNNWNQVGHAKVFYTKRGKFTFKLISRLAKEVDIIYLCGCYDDYAIKAMILNRMGLLKKTLTIAPMGNFSEGALRIRYLKKMVFLNTFLLLGMFKNIIWSVTSIYETVDLNKIIKYKDKEVYIAEDIARNIKAKSIIKSKKEGYCKIAWLSRITPMKNLQGTIEALKKVKSNIEFNIYGPICDNKYWSDCMQNLDKLPSNVIWHYQGAVSYDDVLNTLENNHIFMLQTLGENYGHVIIEALLAGCPCIISDRTPWEFFEDSGIGFVHSVDDYENIAKSVDYYTGMDEERFNHIVGLCIAYAVEKSRQSREALGYVRMFESIMGKNDIETDKCLED